MVDPIEMVVLTAAAEARLEIIVDSLFSARVELGPEPERQQEARSSAEPICDPKISEWCRLLLEAEEIVRKVKADIYRVHNQVLVEHFGAPEGERTEWTQMVSDGALGIRWYQMVSRLMEEALGLGVMSLRGRMEGVKGWLSSETMQGALRRLMEEALREKVQEVYAKITWSGNDDEKGMSFIGLQQWPFALLCCFGECNQRTHVSNPQTAGKYAAAFIWVGWTKSERHG